MVIEFTQRYKPDDDTHKQWAIHVARNQVLKQLVLLASPNWEYSMHFEEIDTTGVSYTFRITLDEVPL